MASSNLTLAALKLNGDIVILIGPIKSGKTNFIMNIPGVKFINPVTHRAGKTEFMIYHLGRLIIVDTPGLDSIGGQDDQILKDIKSFSEEQKISPAFIYCHNIHELKYTASAKRCFESFRKLCGPSLKAAIVTTHWDREGTEYHDRQQLLYKEFCGEVWKEWIQSKRGLYQTNNTTTASENILLSLLKKDRKVGLDDVVIVLLGPIGSGKSTFIKRAMRNVELPEQDPDNPIQLIYDGINRLTFLDTKGLDGNSLSDNRIIKQIKVVCDEQKVWPAFIYCHSVREPRYPRSARDSFKAASRAFSVPVNVAVVTTHWDGEKGVYFKKNNGIHKKLGNDVWAGWMKRGLLFHSTDNTTETADKIVHAVLKNEIRVRKLRAEVDARRTTDRVTQKAVRTIRRKLEDDLKGKGKEEYSEIEAELRILKYYDGPPQDSWWQSIFHR